MAEKTVEAAGDEVSTSSLQVGGSGVLAHHASRRKSKKSVSQGTVEDLDEWLREQPLVQQRVAAFCTNSKFEQIMNAAIVTNVIVMIFEADDNASCVGADDELNCRSPILNGINTLFLIWYTVELALKLFAFRLHYFATYLHWVDAIVVFTGLATLTVETAGLAEGIPSFQALRVIRIARLAKTLKILKQIPELLHLVHGFLSAMRAIFWGVFIIIVMLVFFAIVSVELVHSRNVQLFIDGKNDGGPWCEIAFSSVWNASIYYFQTLVAGDAWSTCAMPLIYEYPYLLILFVAALACVQLGFTNLILAVVVDAAASGREANRQQKVDEKKQAQKEAVEELYDIIQACDTDDSGEVTLKEVQNAFDSMPAFENIFKVLDIDRDDMEEVFNLMDTDSSGTLSYDEFVQSMKKVQLQDPRVTIMLLRLQATQISQALQIGNSMSSSPTRFDQGCRVSSPVEGPSHLIPAGLFQRKASPESKSEQRHSAEVVLADEMCALAQVVASHVDEKMEHVLGTLQFDLDSAFVKLEKLLLHAKDYSHAMEL